MIGAIIGAAVLGVAALVGIAGHYAILKDDDDDDDEGRDALFKTALNKCSQRKQPDGFRVVQHSRLRTNDK